MFATVPLDCELTFQEQAPVAEPVPAVELTPGQRAEALLRDVLTPDARPALEVQRLAGEAGIKMRTLRRTRERMDVRVFKKGRDAWYWELPLGSEE
jgi:hypothetical protein